MLEAMEITSDTTRIRLAMFQLEGEAQVWWKWAKTSRDLEVMTWAEFQELFMGKYFPDTARHAKAQEFLELKQGTMNVMEYVARFTELARFAEQERVQFIPPHLSGGQRNPFQSQGYTSASGSTDGP